MREGAELCASCDGHVTPEDHSRVEPDMSCDSHVTADWLKQLSTALPSEITGPCKVTLGLNIDRSPATVSKLTTLLEHLEGW